ncbi:MAG: PAS domain-containing protein [Deltaproteobacteria bacterium]|nr:PAS domain-containing protein [Deltaproteobacteria bacterium]
MDINNLWKTVFNTLSNGILILDSKGKILEANIAAERMTGYTADELLDMSCESLNCTGCEIYGPRTRKKWCSLFEKGKVRDKKCEITNKDQRIVHIEKNASVLYDEDGDILGAVETLTDITEMVRQQNEIVSLRKSCNLDEGYHGIIGTSESIQHLFELIDSVAGSDAPAMILGQSGSGKELVARAIHEASSRKNKPFIKVNCATLNENLLESELFGHVKGAFSGAHRTNIGRFEAAHEGTIFLDEIGDISLSTQLKLLRVSEDHKIERVGDHNPITVDIRLITATNKDLERLVEKGLFREDLYFRINVFPLHCPSLDERKVDIPLIVQHFISQNNASSGKSISGTTPAAMIKLINYSWPGNVRELRNAIEYAFILCQEGQIDIQHLPLKINSPDTKALSSEKKDNDLSREREYFLQALMKAGGNQSEAARILGVSRVTVWKRIKKFKINMATEVIKQKDTVK